MSECILKERCAYPDKLLLLFELYFEICLCNGEGGKHTHTHTHILNEREKERKRGREREQTRELTFSD